MGKKKSRAHQTSKGSRKSVSTARTSGAKSLNVPLDKALNQQKAWKEGRNVMLTVPNPNPLETNKPFVRVSARSVWGDPKKVRGFEAR